MALATLIGGERLHTHPKSQCDADGLPCSIHNPSDHHMKEWRQHWRDDRGLMERICEHGVGHPDPDDIAFKLRTRGSNFAATEGIHGCDRCCKP